MKTTRLPIIFLLAIASLVCPAGVHPIAAEVNTCPGTGPVNLVLIPQGYTGQVGEQFDVILEVQADTQVVDTVSAFVNFNPNVMQVLSVTPGTALPLVLPGSDFNNTTGEINYEFGKLGGPFPSGTFTLATVRLQGTAAVFASPIEYNCGSPRTTDALSIGDSVLGALQNAFVTLPVTLASFEATSQVDHVLVSWQTTTEIENAGFNLYRATDPTSPQNPLGFVPSQAPGSSQGFSYEWVDSSVVPGQTYYYWLEAIDLTGISTMHGPVSITYQVPTAVTMTIFAAQAIDNSPPLPWMLALLVSLGGTAVILRRRASRRTRQGF